MTWTRISSYYNRNLIGSVNSSIDIVKYELSSKKSSANITIVFISDLHFGSSTCDYHAISQSINSLKADYVLFGGDLASKSSVLDDSFEFLKTITAEKDKFAVIGNWELKFSRVKNISYWRENFSIAGFKLLNDNSYLCEKIIFYGIAPSRAMKKTKIQLPDDNESLKIFIAHNPDDIIDCAANFDIAFAGHTHGGQIRLPIFGAFKTSSRYWRRFDYGIFRNENGSIMIVSSGLGTSCLPVRFLCRPEIIVAEIVTQQKT